MYDLIYILLFTYFLPLNFIAVSPLIHTAAAFFMKVMSISHQKFFSFLLFAWLTIKLV
jgi:hypothetical protein